MSLTAPIAASEIREPLFISPHLDDAVFSCGRLIASLSDPVVATVFAGAQPPGSKLTEWDRAAGFEPGEGVVAKRREEDRRALSVLNAKPIWIELPDRQYAPEPSLDEVVSQLREALDTRRPGAVFFPLGLLHSDHRLTRRAAVLLVRSLPEYRWFAYEDALYRRLPGVRDEAITELKRAGVALAAAEFAEATDAAERKRQAVACYASQLRALEQPGRPGTEDLEAPETYWYATLCAREP